VAPANPTPGEPPSEIDWQNAAFDNFSGYGRDVIIRRIRELELQAAEHRGEREFYFSLKKQTLHLLRENEAMAETLTTAQAAGTEAQLGRQRARALLREVLDWGVVPESATIRERIKTELGLLGPLGLDETFRDLRPVENRPTYAAQPGEPVVTRGSRPKAQGQLITDPDPIAKTSHTFSGNCWADIQSPQEENRCTTHKQPRGDCSTCPRCPACDEMFK
jgi:hypothetical protein